MYVAFPSSIFRTKAKLGQQDTKEVVLRKCEGLGTLNFLDMTLFSVLEK